MGMPESGWTTKSDLLKAIIEKPRRLTPEQQRAVKSNSPYIRVVAGAGTGKTETLTRRIAYLLLYKDQFPESIVAFTFTERAAENMKDRIYERIAELNGEEACAHLGKMYVGTIHAYCLRILEDLFGYGDHEMLDENREMAFLMREGWGLGLGVGRYAENCRTFLKSANVVYDELLDRDKLKKKVPDFAHQLGRYENLLKSHRLLTFGQLISLAVEKIQLKLEALTTVKHLIVDEFQDINRAQEKLIRLIGGMANVFIVGDPRQSIYQWRGSDERCFEDFLEYFKNVDKHSLKENQRSTKSVVKIANAFAATFTRSKYDELGPIRKEDGFIGMLESDTDVSEARWVVKQIDYLVNKKKVCNYSDIAILLRSVTTSSGPFLESLREKGVPFLVGGRVGLFQRDEAQAVGRILAWVADGFWVENPYNWNDRTTGNDLLKTGIDKWKNVSVTEPRRKTIEKELLSWKRSILDGDFQNFTSLYQELLLILGFLAFNPMDRLQTSIMANLGRFNTLLTDYESSIWFGGEKPVWKEAMRGLYWYMNTHATGAYEEQPAEDLRGVDALQVMTVHQAKGLEWPIVFIPCLTNRRFPSSKVGSGQYWSVPREMFDVTRYEGSLEDERRLFYVALTRAKDVLCLGAFRRLNNFVSPSPFVSEIQSKYKKITEGENLPLINLRKSAVEENLQSFSASEIIAYLKCPYMYLLRDLWGYQPGLVSQLGYGKSLHYCLRCAGEAVKGGAVPKHAISEAVEEKFHLPFAGRKQKLIMQKKAKDTLLEFVEHHKEDMLRIDQVESRLEFPVQKATIRGKIDVIMKGEGSPTLEVRDYKTSEEVTTFEDSSLQVRLYTLGLKSIGMPISRASVANLEQAEIREVSIEERELLRAKEKAEDCIKRILDQSFHAKGQSDCKKRCDLFRICRCV